MIFHRRAEYSQFEIDFYHLNKIKQQFRVNLILAELPTISYLILQVWVWARNGWEGGTQVVTFTIKLQYKKVSFVADLKWIYAQSALCTSQWLVLIQLHTITLQLFHIRHQAHQKQDHISQNYLLCLLHNVQSFTSLITMIPYLYFLPSPSGSLPPQFQPQLIMIILS